MAINCQIIKDNQGNIINVEAPNGNDSLLYNSLLSIVNSKQTAVNLWSYSYTDEFNEVESYQPKDFNGEHLPRTVFNNITNTNILESNKELKKSDIALIQETKAKTLFDVLKENIPLEVKERIKVFLAKDKNNIKEIEELLNSQIENPQEIIKELVGIKNRQNFDKKVQDVKNPAYIEKYNSNLEFADQEYSKYSSMQLIEVYNEKDGQLIEVLEDDTEQDLFNALKPRISNVSIASNIEFLNSLEEDVWYESEKEIKNILKDIQTKTINIGIDTTSIVEDYNSKTRTEILNYLNSVSSLTSLLYLDMQTDTDISNFAQIHNEYNKINPIPKTQAIPETEYSVAQISTSLSEKEMFEIFGYIKVAENLYQKVDKDEDFLENIYELAVSENILPNQAFYPTAFNNKGEFKAERVSKPENKEAIKQDIKTYFESKTSEDTNLPIVAFKTAFGHPITKAIEPAPSPIYQVILDNIKEDVSYLTGEFLSELKIETLKEKLKDSVFYNKVLKHLDVNERGIEIKPTANLKEIQFYTPKNHKLIQYTYISKNPQINTIFAKNTLTELVEKTPKFLKNLYVNNPKMLSNYRGEYTITNDNKIKILNKADNFIRIGSTLLERVAPNYYEQINSDIEPNSLFFIKDNTLNDTLAYTPQNTNINVEEAEIKVSNIASQKEINEIEDEIDRCN